MKADLERELEDLIVNARCGLDVIRSAVSAFLRPLGRTECPGLTLSLSENANEDRRSGVSSGCPEMHPLLDLIA